MDFCYRFNDLCVKIFPQIINNQKTIEFLATCDNVIDITAYVSSLSDIDLSTKKVERKHRYQRIAMQTFSILDNSFFAVFDWEHLDLVFYLECRTSNKDVITTDVQSINFLGYKEYTNVFTESIYFVIIDRFIETHKKYDLDSEDCFTGGSFYSLIEKLSYISEFGYTILYLSPIFDAFGYHGYTQKSLEIINTIFGGERGFKKLMDLKNNSTLKIGIEIVLNHVSVFSSIFADAIKKPKGLVYIDHAGNYEKYRTNKDLAKIRYDFNNSKIIYDFITRFISRYDIGFIRLDSCDYIDNYFVNRIAYYCQKKGIFCTGECWNDYVNFFRNYAVDGATNYKLYGLIIRFFVDKSMSVIEFEKELVKFICQLGFNKSGSMLNFIDNHDIQRISSIAKNEKEIITTLSFIFMYIGVPVVYYGTENYNANVVLNPYNRRDISFSDVNINIKSHIIEFNSIRKTFINNYVHFNSSDNIFRFSRATSCGNMTYIYNNSEKSVKIQGRSIMPYDYTIIKK